MTTPQHPPYLPVGMSIQADPKDQPEPERLEVTEWLRYRPLPPDLHAEVADYAWRLQERTELDYSEGNTEHPYTSNWYQRLRLDWGAGIDSRWLLDYHCWLEAEHQIGTPDSKAGSLAYKQVIARAIAWADQHEEAALEGLDYE